MTKEEAAQEAAASADDMDPKGQDAIAGERTLLGGADMSDKDAYGPPVRVSRWLVVHLQVHRV